MSCYRFYKIGLGNHIVAPGEDRDFEGDATALEHARLLANGYAIDVWIGTRFVGHAAAAAENRPGAVA
jgi:hypothetical protein